MTGYILPGMRKGQIARCVLLVILIVASGFGVAAQTGEPGVVLTGTITDADNHTYHELPFDVPADTGRIIIDLSYTTQEQHTAIDMGLFDPARFRGWGGGKQGPVTLSETDATPSYLAGPLPAGTWRLLLGVPNIRPGVRSQFTARIYFARRGVAPTVSTFSNAPLRTGAGWYRGDLHLHTGHSDGSCANQSGKSVPCPVFRVVSQAADRGLDFIAVTDHNTTSHYEPLRELQPYFDRMLIMPGREMTTFEGHANVFGTTEFIDFRAGSLSVPMMTDIFRQVEKLGALISINHPNDPDGEVCMGCRWTTTGADLRLVSAVEAVNDGNAEGPIAGIPFWEAQLNRGLHLTGIGGSDTHRPDEPRVNSGVGHPTTVVRAAELSERAILDGIRAGDVFIDVEGTKDRLLEFTASSVGTTVVMGGDLRAPSGSTIRFSLHVTGANGAHTEVIEDGRAVSLLRDPAIAGDDSQQAFETSPDGQSHWIRVNIRSSGNKLLMVGNPIYW